MRSARIGFLLLFFTGVLCSLFQKKAAIAKAHDIQARAPATHSLAPSAAEAKVLGKKIELLANALASAQQAEDQSYIENLIQSRLKSGVRPLSLKFYGEELDAAVAMASPEEKENRPALMKKLCGQNLKLACSMVYYDLHEARRNAGQAEYRRTKDPKALEDQYVDTPEMKRLAVYSCVELGNLCYQALPDLRGTEAGKLIDTLATQYCNSGLEDMCQDLRSELKSRLMPDDFFCQHNRECQPPDAETRKQNKELLVDLSNRACNVENLEACQTVVTTMGLTSQDPRALDGRQSVLNSCENQNLRACEIAGSWAFAENDFETGRQYANASCDQGNQFSCLQLVKADFKISQDPESLRPALTRLCSFHEQTYGTESICTALANGKPLTSEALKNSDFSAFYDGRGISGGFWGYMLESF